MEIGVKIKELATKKPTYARGTRRQVRTDQGLYFPARKRPHESVDRYAERYSANARRVAYRLFRFGRRNENRVRGGRLFRQNGRECDYDLARSDRSEEYDGAYPRRTCCRCRHRKGPSSRRRRVWLRPQRLRHRPYRQACRARQSRRKFLFFFRQNALPRKRR